MALPAGLVLLAESSPHDHVCMVRYVIMLDKSCRWCQLIHGAKQSLTCSAEITLTRHYPPDPAFKFCSDIMVAVHPSKLFVACLQKLPVLCAIA